MNPSQFLKERAKWKAAGSPTRTPEKAQELFNICSNCEHFKKTINKENHGQCSICGCSLTPDPKIYFNKIGWATTRCPLEEPKWIEEENLNQQTESKEEEQDSPTPPPAPPTPRQGGCGCGGG